MLEDEYDHVELRARLAREGQINQVKDTLREWWKYNRTPKKVTLFWDDELCANARMVGLTAKATFWNGDLLIKGEHELIVGVLQMRLATLLGSDGIA